MPLDFAPPCGASLIPKQETTSLTITVPARMRLARRSPRTWSRVKTLAASPNSESFASLTASSSLLNAITGSTGPKVSSRIIRIAWVMSASTVGL